MGTFEDSGLCKGYDLINLSSRVRLTVLMRFIRRFAFVDFTTIEHATSVLINTKNHLLNGRKLVVEYAGADAVRRGAPKVKREEGAAPPRRRDTQSRGPRPDRPDRRQPQDSSWSKPKEDFSEQPAAVDDQQQQPVKYRYGERDHRAQSNGGRQKGPRVRPKPGAALALAKRESAAIIPSQGQKITF
jgi:RNA recognition motif-containing protein